MNLIKLFNIQRLLDERIVKKHNLQGEDLLLRKILALQIELGKLANEWRGFKFWSTDQEPNTFELKKSAYGKKLNELTDEDAYNPLLEEYVDCLHFILSIGLELYGNEELEMFCTDIAIARPCKRVSVLEQFRDLYFRTTRILSGDYIKLFERFLGLGEMLGFSWEQIEQAYLDKNKVNHQRQECGY